MFDPGIGVKIGVLGPGSRRTDGVFHQEGRIFPKPDFKGPMGPWAHGFCGGLGDHGDLVKPQTSHVMIDPKLLTPILAPAKMGFGKPMEL